jgi:type IX secretion system PorP/SprF family membrane protein
MNRGKQALSLLKQEMYRRIIIAAVCAASFSTMKAQWDVQLTDFSSLKSYFNPAASGTDGLLNVNLVYSMQMVGFDDAPKTLYAGGDCPIYFLGPRHGGGVSFLSDQGGVFRTSKIAVQYAYNLKTTRKGRLAIGVQGAMLSETIDPKNLELEDQNDPAFPTSEVSGNHVDLGAGIFYHHPKYWAGFSAMHLTEPLIVAGETTETKLSRMYYLMGGGNIKLKRTLLTLKPSFMVQSDMQSWREDVNLKVEYTYNEKKMWAGINYSPDISVAFMLGGNFHGISLGYSYQMYTSGINMANGTHELVLSYQAELDLFKKGHNRHKAVRVL